MDRRRPRLRKEIGLGSQKWLKGIGRAVVTKIENAVTEYVAVSCREAAGEDDADE